MNHELDLLARRIRNSPDKAISFTELADELAMPELRVAREIKDLVKRDGFFDIGNQRVMFTGNSDLAAYEIFKGQAIHITYEEFIQYRDQPHLLMRLSRDREVACKSDPEKLLQNAMKEKESKGRNNLR